MKKTLLLSIFISVFFSACFSFQSVNPFSEKEVETKKEIEIPDNAPTWLYEKSIRYHISSIGLSVSQKQNEKLDKKELTFHKQKALISASQNLTKRIYLKTLNLFRDYLEKLENPNIYDKDIKKFAEHIALKSLTHSKIKNSWESENNELYIQIAVKSDIVADQIQNSSKLLFSLDKNLYKQFLSNRARKDIIKELETD